MAHTIGTYEHQLSIEHATLSRCLERIAGVEHQVEKVRDRCTAFIVEAQEILSHRNSTNVSYESLDQMIKGFARTHASTLKQVERILSHVPDGLGAIDAASKNADIEFKQVHVRLPAQLVRIHNNAKRAVRVTRDDRTRINNDTHKISEHLSRAISYLHNVMIRDIKQARKEDSFTLKTLGREFESLSHAKDLTAWAHTALKGEIAHVRVLEGHVRSAVETIEREIEGIHKLQQFAQHKDPFGHLDRAA